MPDCFSRLISSSFPRLPSIALKQSFLFLFFRSRPFFLFFEIIMDELLNHTFLYIDIIAEHTDHRQDLDGVGSFFFTYGKSFFDKVYTVRQRLHDLVGRLADHG